ncbi:hypothetical protein HMPREF1991_01458 [Hoylesella loescheii DSM 19665 = JCM 12249 = ATCC 15930]|uniref:Uncharacterized protein n=1 Tax=Hoylesella loescheii DSM 19665 = JCM 12249 = ATCC 15930 TaxID=1122985 RepID=A0A069QHV4_HOYLO|nr:hypothetical protein HMPREF1991_01458 [Hoylesella loescheii DSM 19665 = JCM 12249 = ATCC 15930]
MRSDSWRESHFLPVQSCSGGMATYPQLANSPFCRSHFHCSGEAFSKP